MFNFFISIEALIKKGGDMKECEEVKKFQKELQDIIKVCGWNSITWNHG